MKKIKSLIAILLVLILALSFSACHKKGEIAITSGDYTITSAMYSYYLFLADSEARTLINKDTENYDTSAENFSYLKQTIEGKKYETYVKDLALKNCYNALAYQKLCDENELKLDDETIEEINSSANYYWNYYGYGQALELNGVGYETYLAATKNDYLEDLYFKHLYDEGGEKEIPDADIQKAMDENYVAAYVLTKDYSSDSTVKVEDVVTQMEGYKDRLSKGEAFEKIYNEYNKVTEETTTKETESTEPAPKDKYISLLGSADTTRAFDKFDEVLQMAQDEIKIISDTDNKVVYLIVKKDINSDSYYKDVYLGSSLLYLLKQDEFDATIDEYVKTLTYTVSNFAIGQFKVKNIDYGY